MYNTTFIQYYFQNIFLPPNNKIFLVQLTSVGITLSQAIYKASSPLPLAQDMKPDILKMENKISPKHKC